MSTLVEGEGAVDCPTAAFWVWPFGMPIDLGLTIIWKGTSECRADFEGLPGNSNGHVTLHGGQVNAGAQRRSKRLHAHTGIRAARLPHPVGLRGAFNAIKADCANPLGLCRQRTRSTRLSSSSSPGKNATPERKAKYDVHTITAELDGDGTRRSAKLFKLCDENNILLALLPSNNSECDQAGDNGPNCDFRAQVAAGVAAKKAALPGVALDRPWKNEVRLLGDSCQSAETGSWTLHMQSS